jgi:Flp pilus assembly protein TadG
LVEFAIVLPVLVMFVIGIVEFGRGYNARIELTSAVREGARYAALGGATATTAALEQKVEEAAPGLKAIDITIAASVLCAGTPVPDNARVTATYKFSYQIPLLGSRAKDLTATGVMRCGG